MRNGWRLEILGEISEVVMGRQLSPSKKLGLRPCPYIRAANIGSWGISLDKIFEMDFTEAEETRFASQIGDTLLVEGGNEKSVGCPGLVTEKEAGLCIQNTVIRCRVKKPEIFHPEFQYQVLRYMYWRRDFAELCAGTTIMHLGQRRAELVPILVPPLPEQKRIVDLISAVDSYIEALQQQLECAKKSRNAVLHELLTTGGDDWVETTIGEISSFISVRRTPEQLSPSSIYVGLEHLEPNVTSINNFDFTSKVSSSLTPFDAGDVLFGRLRPYLHKVALAEMSGFCSPEILVLRANSGVLRQMLLLYCDADSTIKICVERSAGTRMPRTSTDDLASIEIRLPPITKQEKLSGLFSAFDGKISQVIITLEKAKILRSGLLSGLLSGDHEIPTSYDKVMETA